MKRILVTGGAGFIGSHLCERLLKPGNEVICLDNFFTGSEKNIVHLFEYKNFSLLRQDVTSQISVECDEIYNLACPASPVHYQFNGIETIKTSVLGAINTLELAKRYRAKILQASTSEVYGDPQIHPQSEIYFGNVNMLGPRACYDEGKRCAETLFMNYHNQEAVRIKIIRIFNTYGPGMSVGDGRVVSNFIVQALKGKNITIFGNGSHTRSFQYVDDLIDGIMKMMATEDKFTGPVNIGNPEEYKIIDLAHMIIKLTGSDSRIIHMDLPEVLQRRC
jgi:UDP-glucuronate decarboxylase